MSKTKETRRNGKGFVMTESNLENIASGHFKHWSELTDEKIDAYIKKKLASCGLNMMVICPSKNVTYNNVKIPVKNIKVKTKNKFINRYVLKNLKPTNVTAKDQGDYKFSIDVTLTYDKLVSMLC
mgnify:CR=1 FL=1